MHRSLNLYLMIYVDDFKMSGKPEDVKEGWITLREVLNEETGEQALILGESAPVAHFLGCSVKREVVTGIDGKPVEVCQKFMPEFVTACLESYETLAKECGYGDIQTFYVDTPLVNEYDVPYPARKPDYGGGATSPGT